MKVSTFGILACLFSYANPAQASICSNLYPKNMEDLVRELPKKLEGLGRINEYRSKNLSMRDIRLVHIVPRNQGDLRATNWKEIEASIEAIEKAENVPSVFQRKETVWEITRHTCKAGACTLAVGFVGASWFTGLLDGVAASPGYHWSMKIPMFIGSIYAGGVAGVCAIHSLVIAPLLLMKGYIQHMRDGAPTIQNISLVSRLKRTLQPLTNTKGEGSVVFLVGGENPKGTTGEAPAFLFQKDSVAQLLKELGFEPVDRFDPAGRAVIPERLRYR